MAIPRHGSKKTESSSNYYVVLFAKLLLIIVILLWLPSLVDGRSRTARSSIKSRRKKSVTGHVYRKRLDCEVDCMDNYPEESMNCILECISPACYSQIYETGLEPGEVDVDKAGRLQTCAQQEVIEERRQQRQQRREQQ
jgi:hypothetical protein